MIFSIIICPQASILSTTDQSYAQSPWKSNKLREKNTTIPKLTQRSLTLPSTNLEQLPQFESFLDHVFELDPIELRYEDPFAFRSLDGCPQQLTSDISASLSPKLSLKYACVLGLPEGQHTRWDSKLERNRAASKSSGWIAPVLARDSLAVLVQLLPPASDT